MRSKSLIFLSTILFVSLVHFELEAKESKSVDSGPATETTAANGTPEKKNLSIASTNNFSKGTQMWQTYASVAAGDYNKGEMYALHVGYSHFLRDYLSVSIDVLGAYIRSDIDNNGIAVGLDVLFRRHFSWDIDDLWSLYVDGGGGLQMQSTEFSGNRHFNFRLLAGLGGMLHVSDRVSMMGGARYLHISDAGIKGGGGGFDGPMFYVGAMFHF